MKKRWLPNKDLNLDKQFQRLLCYRYTMRQKIVSSKRGGEHDT